MVESEEESDEEESDEESEAESEEQPPADDSSDEEAATIAKRAKTMQRKDECRVKIGAVLHIPHCVFPDEIQPEGGYWVAKAVRTPKGGAFDVGILILGEEIFTRPMFEVASWVVAS